MLTPIVSALTSTSPAPGVGVRTSVYSSTDGAPVRRSRIAFIGPPPVAPPHGILSGYLSVPSKACQAHRAISAGHHTPTAKFAEERPLPVSDGYHRVCRCQCADPPGSSLTQVGQVSGPKTTALIYDQLARRIAIEAGAD